MTSNEATVTQEVKKNPARYGTRTGLGGLFDLIERIPAGNILFAFSIIQLLCITAGLIWPEDFRYISEINISVMLQAIPSLGVIALGVGILMIAGEFDLSIGSIYAFTAIVFCMLVQMGISAWIACPIVIAIGATLTTINGAITLHFNLPSFIVTLGAMLFWKGMIFLIHGAQAIGFSGPEIFQFVIAGSYGIIEMMFVWFVLLAIALHIVLRHHKFGNHVLAVGGNRQAAVANGINPVITKLTCFALAGATAAASGVMSAARVGSVTPSQGGGVELQAIAACVIGGAALTGGRGTVLGVFLGACLIYTIQDVLLLMRAPGFYLDIFVGALIVIAAISNNLLNKESQK